MYIHLPVRFEWDPEKARTNRIKHGIEFADAIEVLFDPLVRVISACRATRREREIYQESP